MPIFLIIMWNWVLLSVFGWAFSLFFFHPLLSAPAPTKNFYIKNAADCNETTLHLSVESSYFSDICINMYAWPDKTRNEKQPIS